MTPGYESENPVRRGQRYLAEIRKLDKSPLPRDRKRAEEVIRDLYIIAQLPPPEKIVWCRSPLAMMAVLALLEMAKPNMTLPGMDADDFVRKCIKDSAVAEAIWADVRGNFAEAEKYYDITARQDRDWFQLRFIVDPEWFPQMAVRGTVLRTISEEVFATTRGALSANRHKSTCLLTHRTLVDTLKNSTNGLMNTLTWEIPNGPVGYMQDLIEFFRLLSQDRYLFVQEAQLELSRRIEWLAPGPKVCFAVEHGEAHFNGAGLLHNAQGPALAFPDGWEIYAWNGVHVPRHVVMNPGMISVNSIDNERNNAVRQVMIERYQGNYYNDCGASLVATDALGRLYRKTRSGKDFVFVRVTNSTREPDGRFKEYTLRVPPEMTSPTQAIAWTFNMTTEQYLKTQKMT